MLDVEAYLNHLGVGATGHPSVAGLYALQAAHLERVPFETLAIQLGRATSIAPAESVHRIVEQRRGGYCYHLNGAFSELLAALGYEVVRHRSGVQGSAGEPPTEINGNHLGLTVAGLPAGAAPDGRWLVDVGLGDGPLAPLPLRAGSYHDGLLAFELRPSTIAPGGWRLNHDPCHGSFVGVDIAPEPTPIAEFAAMHEWLSTSPESGFVRTLIAQRRESDALHILRGRVLSCRRAAGAEECTIDDRDEWFALLADQFGLTLSDVDRPAREALWSRVSAAHEQWLTTS